ncbi:MAG: hypothetical protein JSW34_08055 [Candidatus Zixiibacteriota bacterium]|nr:MAG: hypothetical protein JSW34_08055 [candidate division Zixibacteria bacterium]
MQRFAIKINAFFFLSGLALELSGIGLITRAREGNLYEFISGTGVGWLFVSLYSLFFFVVPAVNIVALLLKDRRILIGPAA